MSSTSRSLKSLALGEKRRSARQAQALGSTPAGSAIFSTAARPALRLSVCFCLAVLAVSTPRLEAQTFYGSIVGTVTDPTGAAVTGAQVTLTNTGTSERRIATTDASGSYQFPNLVPARYRVELEMTGFKRHVHDAIEVQVESVVRVDSRLAVGDVVEVVEVTAGVPLLQTETTSLGQVVESRRVLEMPLNGRNVLSLVALVPGVVPQGGSQVNPTGINIFSVGNFQIGGGFGNQNSTFIDGAPVNSFLVNLTSMLPTQDAIQEFRVQTNNIGPEFGRFSGGVINMTTRSGSNEFHGTAYEFLRNKVLNANTFFNNRSGAERPAFTQNQYGATIGGPIVRDKTFFFVGYEGFQQRQGSDFIGTVPTPAMKNGDFSGISRPIYDPQTSCGVLGNPACTPEQSATGGILRQPFTNNRIPDTRVDPLSKQVQTIFWPNPNLPGQGVEGVLNYTSNISTGGNNHQLNTRVDQTISDKQRIFGRYTRWTYLTLPIDTFKNGTDAGLGREDVWSHQAVFADTYTFTPTFIGDFRVAVLRYVYDRVPAGLGTDLTTLGLPASFNNSVQFRHIPVVNVQNITGNGGMGSVIYQYNDSISIVPNLTVIKGSHTIKFGGEARRMTNNYVQSQNPSGSYAFNNLFTAANPYTAGATGIGYASYLLGFGSTGNVNAPAAYATTMYYHGYHVSDTYQATRKLTLNYGVRWEPTRPFTERYDRMVVLLPNAESPLAAPTGLPLKGKLQLINTPESPGRYSRRPHPRLFAPRTGFAYRFTEKTVIRGGYGIFFPPQYDILGGGSIGPLTNIVTDWVSTLDGSLTPLNRFSNPFPSGLNVPFGRNPAFQEALYGATIGGDVSNPVMSVPGEDERAGYFQQWNFNIQHELLGGAVFEIAYAGAKGTHLQGPLGRNQLLPQFQALGITEMQRQVANPFFGIVPKGTLAARTIAQGQLLRPFPQYNGVVGGDANRTSIYHAMQLRMQKRFTGGSIFSTSYTWSKTISTRETDTFWLESGQSTTPFSSISDNYNLQRDRAISSFDAAHRLVLSYILDLPFGKGKQYLGSSTGVLGQLVSGWGINGITTLQSGLPLGLTTSVNLTNSYGGGSRPNSTGQSAKLEGPAQPRLAGWFDTSKFFAPAPATFGNTARNLSDIRTHGIANFDFTVFKKTALTERVGLEFRVETFNLFNRVQFGRPGVSLGLPTFGVISSQANLPRLVQFALRLSY